VDVASRMNARKNYEDLADVSIYRTFTGAPGICDASQTTWMNDHV